MPGFLVGMLELAPLCMQAVRVSTSTLTPSSPSVLCMSSSAWAVLSVCLSLPGSPPPPLLTHSWSWLIPSPTLPFAQF